IGVSKARTEQAQQLTTETYQDSGCDDGKGEGKTSARARNRGQLPTVGAAVRRRNSRAGDKTDCGEAECKQAIVAPRGREVCRVDVGPQDAEEENPRLVKPFLTERQDHERRTDRTPLGA